MLLTHRPFLQDLDKQLMIDLACQFQIDHLHVVDLPYRLSSWGLEDTENVRLWFDGENLVAWAVLQSPFWGIDYACNAAFNLYQSIGFEVIQDVLVYRKDY